FPKESCHWNSLSNHNFVRLFLKTYKCLYFSVSIRKDHIETEREAARRWPSRWGFLLTSVEELLKDEEKQPPKPKIPLPQHLQIRPVTPVEKYIKIHPSPPVPQTTQGFIGWRSTVPGLELERYYQIRSNKGAFYKDLKWPNEPTD
uniref:Ciliary microtubule inner protein 1 n=1 Tax=Anolis carolinensis TaxID=28377 RepID=A0A803TLI8_ANOCA